MPFTALGQDHFGGEDDASTTWTSVTRGSFDGGRVRDGGFDGEFAVIILNSDLAGSLFEN
jgi:hypothetical protein